MAISSKPAYGGYTVNTSATWCPDLLWMMDEGSGTTLSNAGKGSANNGSLSTLGSGTVSWITSPFVGLSFVGDGSSTNYGLVRSANMQGVTASFTAIGIVSCANTAVNNAIMSVADISRSDTYATVRIDASENILVTNNISNVVTFDTTHNVTADTVHMVAWRFKQGDMGISLDGSDWVDASDGSTAFPGGVNIFDGFSLGAAADASPNASATCKYVAWTVYADVYIDDGGTTGTNINTIYNSGDVWTSFGVTASGSTGRMLLLGVG